MQDVKNIAFVNIAFVRQRGIIIIIMSSSYNIEHYNLQGSLTESR